MSTLYFDKIGKFGRKANTIPLTPDQAALVTELREGYETNGEPTHIAYTELGETAFAFPADESGWRLILVCSRRCAFKADEMATDYPDEWNLEVSDAELESGLEVRAALF